MSAAREHLKMAARTCMGNDGEIHEVVDYAEAVTALHIQKSCLIMFFKIFLTNQFLSNILGEEKDWNKIFNEQIKNI